MSHELHAEMDTLLGLKHIEQPNHVWVAGTLQYLSTERNCSLSADLKKRLRWMLWR